MPEELELRQSIGFGGYRYPKEAQYIPPPVRDGSPLGLVGGSNLYNHEGMLKNFPGLEKVSSAPVGIANYHRVLGMFPLIIGDGTVYFVICTARKIYSFKPGDTEATDITGSTISLTGENVDYFSAVYWVDTASGYDPFIIISNGVDPMFTWNGSGDCATLAGSPPTVRYLNNFAGHIFGSYALSGAVYYSQRDYRNNIDDAEDWSGGTAGAVDLRQSPGDIMGAEVFGEFRYVFKDSSITLCRATGVDPPFDYDEEFLPIGLIAPQTLRKIWRHELCCFLGSDLDFYILRRDGAYDPVGADISYAIRDYPNDESLKYSFTAYIPTIDHIMLFIPTSNETDGYCDLAFAFNLGEYLRSGTKIWSAPIEIGVDMSAAGLGRFRSAYRIGDLDTKWATIGDLPSTIGNLFQDKTFAEVVLADKNGYLWKVDEALDTFPVEYTGTSLVTGDDSDFDTVGNWVATVGDAVSVAGGQAGNCLRIRNNTGGPAQATAELTLSALTPTRVYKLQFYVKNDGAMTEDVQARMTGASTQTLGSVPTSSAWVLQDIVFKATQPNDTLEIRAASNIADGEYFLIDTLTLQDVTHSETSIPWEADFGSVQLSVRRGDYFRLQEHEVDYRDQDGNIYTNKIFDDDLGKVHNVTISGTGKVALMEQRFWGTEEGRAY